MLLDENSHSFPANLIEENYNVYGVASRRAKYFSSFTSTESRNELFVGPREISPSVVVIAMALNSGTVKYGMIRDARLSSKRFRKGRFRGAQI